ncbi:hypothetical protein OCF84_03080 [Shewanella xiamenensis]|uniref:hypothetical protein n=1 Tax=Shewanella xiamenensis TaxID=332186 RepID=UPI0024AD10B9|nr:hypothetical protein [Shewanella xiamenensis]WHF56270.1 hypothetical protein OCF84_03080 [Shewanella xiamenensis]
MAENCFKIIAFYDESDRQLKQFSRLSPISYLLSSVMNALGNVKQDDAANLTAPHAMTSNVKEDFVFGLSREG